jgi:peroxiredoxin
LVTDFANALERIKQREVELYPITTSDDMENTRELEAKYARGKYVIYCDQDKAILKSLSEDWIHHLADKLPAIFIIDKKGTIRYTFFKEPSKDLPKVEEILSVIDTLVE